MKVDVEEKASVTDAQRRLLESHYGLQPHLDLRARMSRGEPLAVGPPVRLSSGMT